MASVEGHSGGRRAEPATNSMGAGKEEAIWMTPQFLMWVMGWTAVSLVEMGTWETEQLWEQVMNSDSGMSLGSRKHLSQGLNFQLRQVCRSSHSHVLAAPRGLGLKGSNEQTKQCGFYK